MTANDTGPGPTETAQPQTANQPMGFRVAWGEWDVGGKTIFVSACVAVGSMLLPWIDIGIASSNGISQLAFLFLAIYIYPVLRLLKQQSIHRNGGIACGAAGIIIGIVYICSKQVEVFGHSMNFAAAGPYVFILACAALLVGVLKYQARQGA